MLSDMFCALYALHNPVHSKCFSTALIYSTAISSNIGRGFFLAVSSPSLFLEELWHPTPWWRARKFSQEKFCVMLSGGSGDVSPSLIYLSLPQLLASPGSAFTHWLLWLNSSQKAMGTSCRKGKPEWTELKIDFTYSGQTQVQKPTEVVGSPSVEVSKTWLGP